MVQSHSLTTGVSHIHWREITLPPSPVAWQESEILPVAKGTRASGSPDMLYNTEGNVSDVWCPGRPGFGRRKS